MLQSKGRKLKDKFLRQFLVPILIGILGSICFSIFFLTYFSNYYFGRKIVKEELQKLIFQDTLAKSKSFSQMVYFSTQGDISKLEKIRDAFQFSVNYIKYTAMNDDEITDNLGNALMTDTVKSAKPLNYGRWFFHPSKTEVTSLDQLAKRQLYTLTHMLILFKAILESDNDPEMSKLRFIVFFDSTELYFDYPYREEDQELFKKPMPQWCLRQRKTPHYYYFRCTDYYYKVKEFDKQQLIYSIGDVYSTGSEFFYSICLKAKEPQYQGINPSSHFIICLTKSISKLWKQLDEFNSILQGYFYIYSINSIVPFYYPKSLRKKVLDDIKKDEFFLNSSFYMDEIREYTHYQSQFSKKYDGNPIIPPFIIRKNNVEWNCTIELISYHINKEEGGDSSFEHYQSIILLSNFDPNKQYKHITNEWINQNITQGIIFFLVGTILTKLIIYMIVGLADSIVRPIRNIKRILKRLNTSKKEEPNVMKLFKAKSSMIIDENNLNPNTNEENPLLTESNQSEGEVSNDENDEDESISTRSKDVNTVFYKLVDLKNSLEAISNDSLTLIDNNLLNYIFAQHNFHVINNTQASHLCNSNIGNLLLKTKQYDKAIYHFQEAIKEVNKEEIPQISLMSITTIDEYLQKAKNTKEDLIRKTDLKKKKLIESRYPKLLYAYKKYFKSFNSLKNASPSESISLDKHNEFSSVHLIKAYKQTLLHYIELAFDYGDKYNIKVALIEYLNYVLDYEVSSNNNRDITVKKNAISELFHIFSLFQVQESQKTKDQMQLEVNQLMLLIQNVKVESDIVNQIKIPSTVLIQKVTYLKGKLYFMCGHYKAALNYFMETLLIDLVSDAKIVSLSLQKILQIAEKYHKAIDDAYNHAQNNRRDGLLKLLEEIQGIIQKRKEHLSYFNFTPKDICIIMMNKAQLSKAMDIYENMITEYDRVAFLFFDERRRDIQLIGRLAYKSNSDIEEIRDYFKRIEDCGISNEDEPQVGLSKREMEENGNELESILLWARNYLMKKTTSNVIREKWFIYLKNSLNSQETQYLIKKNIKKDLFWDSPWYNLVIVLLERSNVMKSCSQQEENCLFLGKSKEEEELLIKKLSFNKSGIVFKDVMEVLKDKMSIRGIIHKRNEFPQEKYEDIK